MNRHSSHNTTGERGTPAVGRDLQAGGESLERLGDEQLVVAGGVFIRTDEEVEDVAVQEPRHDPPDTTATIETMSRRRSSVRCSTSDMRPLLPRSPSSPYSPTSWSSDLIAMRTGSASEFGGAPHYSGSPKSIGRGCVASDGPSGAGVVTGGGMGSGSVSSVCRASRSGSGWTTGGPRPGPAELSSGLGEAVRTEHDECNHQHGEDLDWAERSRHVSSLPAVPFRRSPPSGSLASVRRPIARVHPARDHAPITHRPSDRFRSSSGRAHARENTMDAFRLGLRLGATGLESDVWLTADRIPVLDHDGVVRSGLRRRHISAMRGRSCPRTFRSSPTLYDVVWHGFRALARPEGRGRARRRGRAWRGPPPATRRAACGSATRMSTSWSTPGTAARRGRPPREQHPSASIKEGAERRAAVLAAGGDRRGELPPLRLDRRAHHAVPSFRTSDLRLGRPTRPHPLGARANGDRRRLQRLGRPHGRRSRPRPVRDHLIRAHQPRRGWVPAALAAGVVFSGRQQRHRLQEFEGAEGPHLHEGAADHQVDWDGPEAPAVLRVAPVVAHHEDFVLRHLLATDAHGLRTG